MKNAKMIFDVVMKGVKKHAPKIAVGVGGALLLTGGYLLGKEVPKYKREVEMAEDQYIAEIGKEKLPVKAKVKIAVRHFAAPVGVTLGGIAALCLSVHENEKRIAIGASAATALSRLSEIKTKELSDYKEAVEGVIGEEEKDKIENLLTTKRAETSEEKGKAMDIPPYPPVKGKYWCIDEVFGGQWFQTDIPTLQMVENELTSRMQAEGYNATCSLNDAYYLMGHELIGAGEAFGWVYDPGKGHKMADLRISSKIINGELVIVISPDVSIIDDEYFEVKRDNY